MSEPIQDADAVDRYRREEAAWWANTCEAPPVDEHGNRIFGRACPVPVKPGKANAQAAYKAGCEDEWIDRMNSRYGGEW